MVALSTGSGLKVKSNLGQCKKATKLKINIRKTCKLLAFLTLHSTSKNNIFKNSKKKTKNIFKLFHKKIVDIILKKYTRKKDFFYLQVS